MLVFIAFVLLIGLTLLQAPAQLRQKPWEDWLLDSTGLLIQGGLIPLLQGTGLYQLYHHLLPWPPGCLELSPLLAFSLSFIGVDYLYYWNHRAFHSRWLWPLHQVHHTMTDRDVVGTSRNCLWASFLILYLWVHGLGLYLLKHPSAYALGVSLTAMLDLWRHSQFDPPIASFWYPYLQPWLILPRDHAWHHASSESWGCNYGANFKWWDHLHGTAYHSQKLPDRLGITTSLTLRQKLLWPYSGSRSTNLKQD